jgi:hypothetical protein
MSRSDPAENVIYTHPSGPYIAQQSCPKVVEWLYLALYIWKDEKIIMTEKRNLSDRNTSWQGVMVPEWIKTPSPVSISDVSAVSIYQHHHHRDVADGAHCVG